MVALSAVEGISGIGSHFAWQSPWFVADFASDRALHYQFREGARAARGGRPRPALKKRGFVFVGINVIGGYLTEINVTSPTGIQEINRFDGVAIEGLIWDAIEARLAAKGN